jgi:DNA-binding transcriptional LysR family regulator
LDPSPLTKEDFPKTRGDRHLQRPPSGPYIWTIAALFSFQPEDRGSSPLVCPPFQPAHGDCNRKRQTFGFGRWRLDFKLPTVNVHHLELFYYVARHGGITEAVRNIPYGIQQPAVSGQVAQLEEYLGVTLFQRRPFALTQPGEKLYKFIQPFFSNIDTVAAELQGGKARQIRIGASTTVLRDHLPELFQNLRKKFPSLKLALREGYHAELESWLLKEELDLAVTLIERQSAPGIKSIPLLELPMVLLVQKSSPISTAEQLWKMDRISETLICLPAAEALCKHFQQGLTRLDVDWFPGIEVSSVDLIETYVANGFGIGLSVEVPNGALPSNVRRVPLPGFPNVALGALWRGKSSPLLQAFLDELRVRAKKLGGSENPQTPNSKVQRT